MRLIFLGALATGTVACSKPNPVVCCTSPADCNSLGVMDTTRPCNDGFVCIDHECNTAPPIDAAPACIVDMDCPANAPHCASSQTCVQCLQSSDCTEPTPVCDSASNTCRGCSADSECTSEVCDTSAGTCVDEANVVYASPAGMDSAACTHADPCSITHAVAVAGPTRNTVKLAPGNYVANLTISNKAVRMLGVGTTITAGAGSTGFEINDGADVTIIGVNITNLNTSSAGTAIQCEKVASGSTPKLSLQQVTIDAMGMGLLTYPCTVTMLQVTSKLRDPSRYQIYAIAPSVVNIDRSSFDVGNGLATVGSGGVISVRNSIISNMNLTGTESALIGGSFLGDSTVGTATATFTTFVNAPLRCPASGTPSCVAGGVSVGVCVRDSILLSTNGTDVATGGPCQVYYSIAMPQIGSLTGFNNLVNVDPRLADVAHHNFALTSSSPAIDAAETQAIDPFDFLGVPRPQGASNDMGAFEFKP